MQRTWLNGRGKRIILLVICIVSALALILVDRLTKNHFVKLFGGNYDTFERRFVIENFFFFTLRANEGAAWSFLSGVSWAQTFFKIMTCLAIVVMVLAFYYGYKRQSKWLQVSISVMFAGTIGNFIDRLIYNFVVDFIGFQFGNYTFPIFNVADICLTIGTIMVVIYLLFLDKNAIFKKNEKVEDNGTN